MAEAGRRAGDPGAVSVVMPPVAARPYPIDLLLCGHHYRAGELSLLLAGATAYDPTGIVSPAGEEPVLARPHARDS